MGQLFQLNTALCILHSIIAHVFCTTLHSFALIYEPTVLHIILQYFTSFQRMLLIFFAHHTSIWIIFLICLVRVTSPALNCRSVRPGRARSAKAILTMAMQK